MMKLSRYLGVILSVMLIASLITIFAVFAGKLTDMDFSAILEVRKKLQEARTHAHTHYSTGECFAPLR